MVLTYRCSYYTHFSAVLPWCSFWEAAPNLPMLEEAWHLFINPAGTGGHSCSASLNLNGYVSTSKVSTSKCKPCVPLCSESELYRQVVPMTLSVSLKGSSLRLTFSKAFPVDINFLYKMSLLCLYLKKEKNLPLSLPENKFMSINSLRKQFIFIQPCWKRSFYGEP